MKKHGFCAYAAAVGPALVTLLILLLNGLTGSKVSALYSRAEDALQQQDYSSARSELQQLKEIAPDYVPQYILEARLNLATINPQTAYSDLQDGIRLTGSRRLIRLAQAIADGQTDIFGEETGSAASDTAGQSLPEDWDTGEAADAAATPTLTCNLDFIVRYTDSQLDPQVQLSVPDAPDSGWTWSSTAPEIARVDEQGLVTCGTTAGEACIRAVNDSGQAAECWVFVLEPEIYAGSLPSDHYADGSAYYIPEGDLSFSQGGAPGALSAAVQYGNELQQLPRITVTGAAVADSSPYSSGSLSLAQGGGGITGPVDENGNPISRPTESTAETAAQDGGEIGLQVGWEAIYFSGEYRIPEHLRSNGVSYTTTSVQFNFGAYFTALSVPASVTSLGDEYNNPFAGFTELQQIRVDEGNPSYRTLDGVLYTADMTRLIAYPANADATEYTVPDTVTSIGPSAFANNRHLRVLNLPASLTEVGYGAFQGMQALEHVNSDSSAVRMQDGLLLGGNGTQLLAVPAGAGDTVTIPAGVTTLDNGALDGNPTIRQLIVEADADYLYLGKCPALESVTVNGSLVSLTTGQCPALSQVTVNGEISGVSLYGCPALETVVLNAPVYSLQCAGSALKSLTNSQNVTQALYLSALPEEPLSLSDTLTFLSIQCSDPESTLDLSGLTGGGALTQLVLASMTVTNMDSLPDLGDLTSLSLWQVKADSLDVLWQCTDLTVLSLSHEESLTSLDGIQALTGLSSLDISGCTALTDVSVLYDLPALSSVSLSGSGVPQSQIQELTDRGVYVY